MKAIDRIHEKQIFTRRVEILSALIALQLPPDAAILDVGCGDGSLAQRILSRRPDVRIRGLDTLIRTNRAFPVEAFDGQHLPHADNSFDVVLFVDVLHHADDPMALLWEATRTSRRWIVIKDHLASGWFAEATLRFMDRVGNARHGVALPYQYWTPERWDEAFRELGLRKETHEKHLQLYPWPFSAIFDRGLHFLSRLALPQPHDRD